MFEAAAFRNEKQETYKVVFPCYSVISVAVLISLLLANFAALALFLIECCGPCRLAERWSALIVVLYQKLCLGSR